MISKCIQHQNGHFERMNIIKTLSLWLHDDAVSLCAQGFLGDVGERGPPGPDGNPVSEKMWIPARFTHDWWNPFSPICP